MVLLLKSTTSKRWCCCCCVNQMVQNPSKNPSKHRNRSMEKRYESEKKSHLSVSSALVTVPCNPQRVTVSKRCESQIQGSQTPAITSTVILHYTVLSWPCFKTQYSETAYFLVLRSSCVTGWATGEDSQWGIMTTLASAVSLSQECEEHRTHVWLIHSLWHQT